jgi:hypothetical protein
MIGCKKSVLVGVFAAFSVACAYRGPLPAQTYPEIEPTSSVMVLDKAAYKLVAIQNMTVDRDGSGRLEVKLELANLSKKDLPVQAQTLYRDKDGMLLGDATPFEMIVLPGNGSGLYNSTSLQPQTHSFTVQIKTP